MRRLAPLLAAALALLGGCTVTTTGAPCDTDLNCPTGQGCGSDGRCSSAALSCPGHGEDGQCRPGTSCANGQLVTCSAGNGVCSTGPVASDCPAHQACAGPDGSAACACIPGRCSAAVQSFCSGGQVASCAQDGSNALGCWYVAGTASCTDPAQACVEQGGAAACACPATDACSQANALSCSGDGTQVRQCLPAAQGSACLTWQPVLDCTASGLVCGAGACVCPSNGTNTWVADSAAGSAAGASVGPTGIAAPAQCRFRSLADALAAATAHGPGATVRLSGWSAATPGGTATFVEPGALVVGAGVAVTTDDATPGTAHYAVTTAAPLAVPLLTLGPGASLSGFEIRNQGATGAAVETACPAPSDVAAVSLDTVLVTGAAGSPPVRFASGVRVTGHCPATLSSVTVTGAATALSVESAGPDVASTASSCTFGGATVAGVSVVEGRLALTGGSVTGNATGAAVGVTGSGSPSLSATSTTFEGNAGDGVQLARGSFTADACPFTANGTHVHAEPLGGAALSLSVRNSSGASRMSGAANSAFRVIAAGNGSTVEIVGNEIRGNSATQGYNVASGMRRGGGLVLTAPFPGSVTFRGNVVAGNAWDQVLVAASGGTLDLGGGSGCGAGSNAFACYDTANGGVGLYSNGSSVNAAWNRWTAQPAVPSVDVAGTGISGYDTSACAIAAVTCP
jgi:hypothetical protein